MESRFTRRDERPPRHDAALEEIRRLFARYRGQPRRAAEGDQLHDGDDEPSSTKPSPERPANPHPR